MKKILTILAVALLSTATVFAVNFSGSTTVGYQFNFRDGESAQYFYGDDGDDTNPSTLKATVSDENGIWSVSLRAGVTEAKSITIKLPSEDLTVGIGSDNKGATLADTGSMGGDVTINIAKLFGLDDFEITAGMIANDRFTTQRAYSNQSGNNYDRIRTNGGSYVAWLGLGYGGYVSGRVAVDPGLNGGVDDNITTTSDVLASVLVTPVDGVEVSVDWALKGDKADGLLGAAFDANIGKIAKLDFTIGVSGAWKWDMKKEAHVVAATVYGGVDAVDGAIEYAYDKGTHYLYAGVNLKFLENVPMDVYFGANNLEAFADTFFVGGDIGYSIGGMKLNLGVEYAADIAAKPGDDGSYNYDRAGFNIVPSVSFSW